jgi:hypothetical protein
MFKGGGGMVRGEGSVKGPRSPRVPQSALLCSRSLSQLKSGLKSRPLSEEHNFFPLWTRAPCDHKVYLSKQFSNLAKKTILIYFLKKKKQQKTYFDKNFFLSVTK